MRKCAIGYCGSDGSFLMVDASIIAQGISVPDSIHSFSLE
jgi:hypothetical protein